MPIYEYQCRSCDELTSVLVRGFNSPDSVKCEHCGSTETSRVMSTPAINMGLEKEAQATETAQKGRQDAAMKDVAQREVKKMMKRYT